MHDRIDIRVGDKVLHDRVEVDLADPESEASGAQLIATQVRCHVSAMTGFVLVIRALSLSHCVLSWGVSSF